jgi:hypothetical protein
MFVDLIRYIQNEGEKGHSNEYAIVGLTKDREIWIVIKVRVEFAGIRPRVSR